MKKLLTLLISLVTVAAASQPLPRQHLRFKQDFLTKFDNISTHKGLSSNQIIDIFQDKFGYMWFATDNGLNRYDGIRMVVYKNSPLDSNSLSNDFVTSICEDKLGNLWVGTANGINYFDRKQEKFFHPFLKPSRESNLSESEINAVAIDSEGDLWVETGAGVLHHFNFDSNLHETINHPKDYGANSKKHLLYIDKAGYIWFGGPSMGPFRYDPRTRKLVQIKRSPLDPTGKKLEGVNDIMEDAFGTLWLASNEGTHIFDPVEETFFQVFSTPISTMGLDSDGMIWLGTFDKGIYRFDPKRGFYTILNNNPNNPVSLTDNHVNKIFVDRAGTVWVGTDEGISKYSPNKYKFEHYFHLPEMGNFLSSNNTTAFAQDERGIIWIGTADAGLNSFDRENGVFTHYTTTSKTNFNLPSNNISALLSDGKGNIWIGFKGVAGLGRLNILNATFKIFYPNNRQLTAISEITADKSGKLWIAGYGGDGLLIFDPNIEKYVSHQFNPINQPLGKIITSITADAERDELWIGTYTSGIYLFSRKTANFKHVYPTSSSITSSDLAEKLPTMLSCAYSNGKVWFGTSSGILMVDTKSKQVRKIPIFRKKFPVSVNSITPDAYKNALLLGTDEGPYLLNISTGTIAPFTHSDQAINILLRRQCTTSFDAQTNTVFIAAENHLFIFKPEENSTWRRLSLDDKFKITKVVRTGKNTYVSTNLGLYLLNIKSLKLEKISAKSQTGYEKQPLLIKDIFTSDNQRGWLLSSHKVYEANGENSVPVFNANHGESASDELLCGAYMDGCFWLGTENGLVMFDPDTKRVSDFNTPDSVSIFSNKLTAIATIDNQVWVGDEHGTISIVNTRNLQVKHLFLNPDNQPIQGSSPITQIYCDSRQRIWIVSNNLYCYNQWGQRLAFPFIDNIQNQKVKSIVEDYEGRLWIATDNGCYAVNPENGSTISYFETDGLQGNSFNRWSLRLLDGSMLVGGKNGFNIINPSKIVLNQKPPQVELSGVKVFNRLLGNDFTQTKSITLPYNQNYLTIDMASLDFSTSEKIRYSYILEGLNSNWINNGNQSTAIFTNLAPGTYHLKVKASNNDGIWNTTPKELTIIIKPPFWKSWWFMIIVFLAIAFGIYNLVRIVREQIKFREKTIELEQRLLLTQMNPHFIFNSLTAIQSYIFRNDPKSAGKYLASFAKLVRLILENSRNKYTTIGKEIKTLEHYLELQSLRFDEKFEFKIEADPEIERESMTIPPMLTQPFIENAIEHGVINVAGKGHIIIRYLLQEEIIIIEVEDDGIGINKALASQKEGAKNHVSLATKISKERLENLNKLEKGKISMEIVDLADIDPLQHGTKVTFKIPYKWVETSFRNS